MTAHPMTDDRLGVAIQDALAALEHLRAEAESCDDPTDLAWLLRAIDWSRAEPRGLKQNLDTFVSEVKGRLARHVKFDTDLVIEGIGMPITRTLIGTSEKWDWGRLAPRVAAQVADEEGFDREDGVAVPPGVLAEKVAVALADCAALTPSKAGRKGSLTKRGIFPADYIEKEPGTPSVRWQTR